MEHRVGRYYCHYLSHALVLLHSLSYIDLTACGMRRRIAHQSSSQVSSAESGPTPALLKDLEPPEQLSTLVLTGYFTRIANVGFARFAALPLDAGALLDIEVDVELLASLAGTRHGSPASILR
jgi:hypothetical protein